MHTGMQAAAPWAPPAVGTVLVLGVLAVVAQLLAGSLTDADAVAQSRPGVEASAEPAGSPAAAPLADDPADSDAPDDHPAPGVEDGRPMEPAPPPSPFPPLGELFLDPPAGFFALPETTEGVGPLTLEEYAAESDDPELWSEAMASGGFEAAYARVWFNHAGDGLIVELVQFATADGARLVRSALEGHTRRTREAEEFSVSGDHGMAGFLYTETDDEGTYQAATIGWHHGRLFVLVVYLSEAGHGVEDPRHPAIDLAHRQHGRLP